MPTPRTAPVHSTSPSEHARYQRMYRVISGEVKSVSFPVELLGSIIDAIEHDAAIGNHEEMSTGMQTIQSALSEAFSPEFLAACVQVHRHGPVPRPGSGRRIAYETGASA